MQLEIDVKKAKKLISSTSKAISEVEDLLTSNDRDKLMAAIYRYSNKAEKLTNHARLLPIATGSPTAKEDVFDIVINETNTNIEVYENKICIDIPSLLPKKESGTPSYIRTIVDAAFKKYIKNNGPLTKMDDVVLVFQHCYSAAREEREYRDHDNIELNAVIDIIALYALVDDAAMKCKHYYCSRKDQNDHTKIFVMKPKDFINWLIEET